jgi:hypothetical protein
MISIPVVYLYSANTYSHNLQVYDEIPVFINVYNRSPLKCTLGHTDANRTSCFIYLLEISPVLNYLTHRLKVFENKVLKRIFGPKRDEVTRGWKKLHNEELHDVCSSPSIIRRIKSKRMRWVGHVARMAEKRNEYRLLVGKPEGKRPLGRPKRWWVDNIKMDLLEIGWGGVDWIGLAQDW